MISALGVHADVRAAGVHVVLELLALVDVLTGPEVLASQAEAGRAGATNARNPVRTVHSVTVMGTVPVVALAAIYRNASSVVAI